MTKEHKNRWAFPDDEQLMTLQVTLPNEEVATIDEAVRELVTCSR